MPFSHHSHSGQFCKHGSGKLEDVVKEAIRQGFEVYGLTEHVPRYRLQDLYPEEVRMKPQEWCIYIQEILNLEKHQSRRIRRTIR